MLGDLAAEYPSIEAKFAEASEVLGFDLWAMTQQGSAEQLGQTENTQPALLVASVALWDLWPQIPQCNAGDQQCRLRILCLTKLFRRPLLGHRP